MFQKFALILCLIAMVPACQRTGGIELTDVQRQQIAETIRQLTQESIDLSMVSNEENFNKGMASWVESDEESWMNNPALFVNRLNVLSTKEDVDKAWRPTIETRSSTTQEITKDYVAVLSENHAIHVYEANWSVLDKSGNMTAKGPMTATLVWAKKNGEWKTMHFHQSWNRIETEK